MLVVYFDVYGSLYLDTNISFCINLPCSFNQPFALTVCNSPDKKNYYGCSYVVVHLTCVVYYTASRMYRKCTLYLEDDN